MFYNPATMEHPGVTLSHIYEADANDRITALKLRMHEPYASREDAISEDTSRNIHFYENGVLYEATRTGSWAWKPCTEPVCEPGINWDTYYAPTVEQLREYLKKRYTTISDFSPRLNAQGLYVVQVHYDGRCR